MVCETEKPKREAYCGCDMNWEMMVPFPTPEGPHTTRVLGVVVGGVLFWLLSLDMALLVLVPKGENDAVE